MDGLAFQRWIQQVAAPSQLWLILVAKQDSTWMENQLRIPGQWATKDGESKFLSRNSLLLFSIHLSGFPRAVKRGPRNKKKTFLGTRGDSPEQ